MELVGNLSDGESGELRFVGDGADYPRSRRQPLIHRRCCPFELVRYDLVEHHAEDLDIMLTKERK